MLNLGYKDIDLREYKYIETFKRGHNKTNDETMCKIEQRVIL